MRDLLGRLKRVVKGQYTDWHFRLASLGEPRFECPICGYHGPFRTISPATGTRRYAQCPQCGAAERHRLQYSILRRVLQEQDLRNLRVLHVAPEPFLRRFLEPKVARYETADLCPVGVDHQVDLQALPFSDASYDLVYASHVLEHVPDDIRALSEIRRVLSPEGIAILPVPVVADITVDYPAPNPNESDHVRAPGHDYFDRYERFFPRVDRFDSTQVPERYQTFVYEDRTGWPNAMSPLRPAMSGHRHHDVVPVCYVAGRPV